MISGPDYKEKLGTIVSHLYKAAAVKMAALILPNQTATKSERNNCLL